MILDRFLPDNPRLRRALGLIGLVIGVLVVTQLALPGAKGTRGVPEAVLFRSLVLGLVTSLTTAGLILVYRISRVINFAQIAIGAAGAQLTFLFVRFTPQVPFALSLLLGVLVAAGLGALFDITFGRRFASAPRLVMTVVTISGALFLGQQAQTAIERLPFFPPLSQRPNGFRSESLRAYLPFNGLDFTIGSSKLEFGFPEILAIELSLLALLAVFLFFRFTRAGVAVRAVAENTDRASLLGISVGLLSTLVWAMAGALSGITVTVNGLIGNPGSAFGFSPTDLLPALAAAVLVRFRSLPRGVVAAVSIVTLTESFRFAVPQDRALIDTALFVVVMGGIALQRQGSFRTGQTETSWSATEEQRPIPKELSGVRGLRVARYGLIALVVGLILALPFIANTGLVTLAATVATSAIVALSLVVLTGWAGQVSLGQFGFVAVGSVVEAALAVKVGIPFWFAVPLATAVTGVVAALVGIPALRVRGLLLAVATFAFSVGVVSILFDERYFGWLLVTDRVPRPTLFFLDFDSERSMYYLCVAAFLLSVVVVTNLRKSRTGRLLIAVRENEANVQSFGIPLLRTKLTAFAISGGLAGFSGALLVHQLRTLSETSFAPGASFNIFVYTVIGGVSSVPGALLGAAFPQLSAYIFGNNRVFAVISGAVPLFVLYSAPGGFISLLLKARDSVLRIIAQRRQIVVPSLFADYDPAAIARQLIPLAEPLPSGGLSALSPDDRYAIESELYALGLGSDLARAGADGRALTAATEAAGVAEMAAVGAGPVRLEGDEV